MQRDMLMDKMKSAHVENHNMIEVHYDRQHAETRLNLEFYIYKIDRKRWLSFS